MGDEQGPGQCDNSADRLAPGFPGVAVMGSSSLGAGSVPVPGATAQAGGDGPALLEWCDMPSRIIRESCRTSPNLDQLSDGAERMFWRLTTVCDDYGRFDADPRVLLALCFPLRSGSWKVEKITIWRKELVTHNLICLYEIGERTYGYFVTWRKWQRARQTKPKFPSPPESAATCRK